MRQSAQNAGKEGAVIVNEVENAKTGTGYNAATDKMVSVVPEGIVDPKMVTRSALQNAVSIAANFLTMEAAITDGEKTRKKVYHKT